MKVVLASKAYVLATYRRKAEEIAARGADLTLVAPPSWRDERGVMAFEPGEAHGYRLERLPISLNGHYHLHWNRGLWRLLRRIRPDILHIEEEPYNFATFLAAIAARRVGAKVVFFTWQNLMRRYPAPFSLFERYVYSASAHAIAGNDDAVAVLRAKGYRGPVTVIPQFGVDPELFTTRVAEPKRFTVGYVGRLVPEKGVDLLLQACATLHEHWQLLVLGSGPERPRLEAQAVVLGVAGRVEFLAPMPSASLPAHLHRLSCLVLPSRSLPNWVEQFGRVLVEAMSCGVPVITTTCGEAPHVVGDAGLVAPEDDGIALGKALDRLCGDAALRVRLAAAGRRRVLERYTQASIAARTVAVYERILRERAAGAAAAAGRRRSAQ